MSPTLEERYRRLLRAYPKAYRAERGDEIVDTLIEGSRPDQRRPTAREATALLLGGLRTRAGHQRSTAAVWAGGAHLAILFLLTYATGYLLMDSAFNVDMLVTFHSVGAVSVQVYTATGLSIAALAATALGRRRWAAALIGLTLAANIWATGVFLLRLGFVGTLRELVLRFTDTNGSLWELLTAGGLTVVLLRRPAPRSRRSLWWLAAVPVVALPMVTDMFLPFLLPGWVRTPLDLLSVPVVFLAVLVCLAWTVVDARVPMALGALSLALLVPRLADLVHRWPSAPFSPYTNIVVLAVVVFLALGLAAVRAPRQARI